MRAKITEHTTTDDPYCEVESVDTGDVAEFFGSIDEFKALYPSVEIVEEIWS